MTIKYKPKKYLCYLPCRFILGVIGHSKELSPKLNKGFLNSVKNEFGSVEDILPVHNFPNSPESYFTEMGRQPLATTMIVLEKWGAYTDLHRLEKRAKKVEKQFLNSDNGRTFNINPGAIGTFGLCLISHKDTGGRRDMSTYAYGPIPHLFSGGDSYYERVMKWRNGKLIQMQKIKENHKFPEYTKPSRIKKFEGLVKTLPNTNVSIELMADHRTQ